MRLAEFVMAVFLAIFSLYLMWKSAELPIGWLPGKGLVNVHLVAA